MQISIFKRDRLKIIGICLIIMLIILRFAILPLNNSVKGKKANLNEYLETYRMKLMLAQRKKQVDETLKVSESAYEREEKIFASLYPKDSHIIETQSETIKAITKSAEKNGLSMINFQIPERVVTEDLSEIYVVIRLEGMPNAIIGLLNDINEMKMITDVKHLQISPNRKKLFTVQLTLVNYRIES